MHNDINRFITDLAKYINTNIVGSENSYIERCVVSDMVLAKGHAIPIEVVLPEKYREKFKTVGPCFYAEELMQKYPDATIAAIGEIVNNEVTGYYPTLVRILRESDMDRTLDKCDINDVIMTALPSGQVPESNREGFITKEIPEFRLTITLKARFMENLENKNQSCFIPVRKKDGETVPDKLWEHIAKNTFNNTEIEMACLPTPYRMESGIPIQVCGYVKDNNSYYDYFYLLSLKDTWEHIAKETGSDTVYIIPTGAYSAIYALDGEEIRKNPGARSFRDMFLNNVMGKKMEGMEAYVLNCNTWKTEMYKKGDGSFCT